MNRDLSIVVFTVVLAAGVLADEPKELVDARKAFAQASPQPDEAARVRYVTGLVGLRDKFARANATADWEAVDAEARRNPEPKDVDAKALAKAMVGTWASHRHETLYRKDGSWSLLPVEAGDQRGAWRIEGNELVETEGGDRAETHRYTLILLTEKDRVFTDGKYVFYETRKKK